ncbi:MAG: FGGY-family carbohydrate kinase [Promethearchaeota archaeon]
MENSDNKILTIDISSNNIKVGLVTENLELENSSFHPYEIINEDIDGFAKSFDMTSIWKKINSGIKEVLKRGKLERLLGISSCGQRMAAIFLDKAGHEIYGGPNTDIRGIDSAYLIEDHFSEEELFKITGHNPSVMFILARLLWFQEEREDKFKQISKILMLDDWIGYKLTGKCYSDYTSVGESQLFDVNKKIWSSEIINAFNFNNDLFPEIVNPGTVIGNLKSELIKEYGLKQTEIPVVKGCGDTQANLIGMGVIENGNIGITLGTTAPVHLVVNKPIFDTELNFWTECHIIDDKWLIEANTGSAGRVYDWFKDAFLHSNLVNGNDLMDTYLHNSKPGAGSTYAFLGPEFMTFKDMTSIKRGIFVFQPPSMIGEDLPKIQNFARSCIENICFGVLENVQALYNFTDSTVKIFTSGGLTKSKEICTILTNILNKELYVPVIKESAFIGCAMNVLVGLKLYSNYKTIVNELINFEKHLANSSIAEDYNKIYTEWKNLKKKLDYL